jgi:hypothetical protein
MRILILLTADVVFTVVACGIFGPAASKWAAFGLPGLLMRAPFYLLRFYIGLAVLAIPERRNWLLWGSLIGIAFTAPLAFLSFVPGCPRLEPVGNLLTGLLQGVALSWTANRLSQRTAGVISATHS